MSSFGPGTPWSVINEANQRVYGTAPVAEPPGWSTQHIPPPGYQPFPSYGGGKGGYGNTPYPMYPQQSPNNSLPSDPNRGGDFSQSQASATANTGTFAERIGQLGKIGRSTAPTLQQAAQTPVQNMPAQPYAGQMGGGKGGMGNTQFGMLPLLMLLFGGMGGFGGNSNMPPQNNTASTPARQPVRPPSLIPKEYEWARKFMS